MDHVLARLRGVSTKEISTRLQADVAEHAGQGFRLEQLWENVDDPGEAWFLFGTDDLQATRAFIEQKHAEARRNEPNANLPEMIFLRGAANPWWESGERRRSRTWA